MTIERGQPWGAPGGLPAGSPIVESDIELRTLVEEHRRRGTVPPIVGLTGGDLCRTMGGGGPSDLHDEARPRLPVDVGVALLDGKQYWFVAHLIARRAWLRGRVFVAMNAEWHGDWDLAPRSHPNDGYLDTYDTTMSAGQRLRARRRLRSGDHVPHPEIRYRRTTAIQITFEPQLSIWIDGERRGSVQHASIRIEPDAITVVV